MEINNALVVGFDGVKNIYEGIPDKIILSRKAWNGGDNSLAF